MLLPLVRSLETPVSRLVPPHPYIFSFPLGDKSGYTENAPFSRGRLPARPLCAWLRSLSPAFLRKQAHCNHHFPNTSRETPLFLIAKNQVCQLALFQFSADRGPRQIRCNAEARLCGTSPREQHAKDTLSNRWHGVPRDPAQNR